MCQDLYLKYDELKPLFKTSEKILGFDISKIMFEGSKEELTQTKVTQPAIFIHSMAIIKILGESFKPNLVAGHSLGEFSALVASGALNFEDGLKLVSIRAKAMQKSCEKTNGTMAAILGLENKIIVKINNDIISSYELKNKILTTLILANEEVNQENINKSKPLVLKNLIECG